jgi:predicted nuclease of predicted toxin-antitoxin system
MKLLFDENLSDRAIPHILDLYPDSSHVKAHGLTHGDDGAIWDFAQQHGYILVSKDSDFHQRSLLFGGPPKFVYLRIGNGPTREIIQLLRASYDLLSEFTADPGASILILPLISGE